MQVVKAGNHSWPVNEFYQRDLEEGNLYFLHKGADYGRAVIQVKQQCFSPRKKMLVDITTNAQRKNKCRFVVMPQVTDEQYYVMGLFEVQASEPYIRFSNNTGIAVQRGHMTPITPSNLSIETNLDVEDRDVRFIVNTQPMYGKIKKNNQERSR